MNTTSAFGTERTALLCIVRRNISKQQEIGDQKRKFARIYFCQPVPYYSAQRLSG